MSRLHGMTMIKRDTGNAAIEQLLEALDLEAATLSSDVTDRLATARHQAIGNTRLSASATVNLHCIVDHRPRRQNERSAASSRASQHPSLGWKQTGYSLIRSIYVSPAFRTAVAGLGVASLTALLVLDGPKPQDTREELVAMTTTDSQDMSGELLERTTPPALKSIAFDTQPDEHLPLISSKDSLDLVGSVDFLLWLDSQQG